MVCFYFYHPGGAPRFSWFSCVFIWWYFWCILMCSCVLFLVRFSRVFCRAFSGVFWWFCWWYFLCFSWCFFHCVLVLFSVLFFVLVPFLFYIRFPLVVVLFFAVLFFVVFGCFFRAFFRAFCGVFFSVFYRAFFRAFFRSFSRIYFRVFFFVPWVAPETNNHNILHFGPCFFRCFFWWSLLVKIGYTQPIVKIGRVRKVWFVLISPLSMWETIRIVWHLAIQTMKHRDSVLAVATCSLCYTSFNFSDDKPRVAAALDLVIRNTVPHSSRIQAPPVSLFAVSLPTIQVAADVAVPRWNSNVARVARQNKECAAVCIHEMGTPWNAWALVDTGCWSFKSFSWWDGVANLEYHHYHVHCCTCHYQSIGPTIPFAAGRGSFRADARDSSAR